MKTWLQDASDSGAKALVEAHVERILVEDGAGAGHRGDSHPRRRLDDGAHRRGADRRRRLRRHRVARPAAALGDRRPGRRQEPPPASRLHGGGRVRGAGRGLARPDPVAGLRRLRGPRGRLRLPDRGDGHVPRPGRGEHAVGERRRPAERSMQTLRWLAPFISVARDHGSGQVVIDEHGRAVVRWGLDDPVDRRLAKRANVELCRIHQAAGGDRGLHPPPSRAALAPGRGLRRLPGGGRAASYEPNDVSCFSGAPDGLLPDGLEPGDLGTADGRGELHDTKGGTGSATARRSRRLPASTRWSRSCRWPTAPPSRCWPR